MGVSNGPVFRIHDLRTEFRQGKSVNYAVNGAGYEIFSREIVGLVGESGCGKSVMQYSALRLLPRDADAACSGQVCFKDKDLLDPDTGERDLRALRGGKIAMVFQDPMASLDPLMSVGEQIAETIRTHLGLPAEQARQRAVEMMRKVRIPDAEQRYADRPYQLSGGMCQRIMIAIAISCGPELLIADEMTTALDVTTQAQILELLKAIVRETGTALLIITHNLGLIAHYADRIYIMYAGQMVEWGSAEQIFRAPAHAYTLALLHAAPRLGHSRDRLLATIDGLPPSIHTPVQGCLFYPRCKRRTPDCEHADTSQPREVEPGHFTRCILPAIAPKSDALQPQVVRGGYCSDDILLEVQSATKIFAPGRRLFGGRAASPVRAVQDVSLKIHRGEALGLVGESGCGKTTLTRCILGLTPLSSGTIRYEGEELTGVCRAGARQKIQLVFQNSGLSFDPRQTIGQIVGEPLLIHGICPDREARQKRVEELLALVKLDPAVSSRRPHEISGGQQQRVGIARALACEPELLLCDEPVSALDVSVQAQIINLFLELKQKLGLTYLFISHDLSVVQYICDNVAVMYRGRIVEYGGWNEIYHRPLHPYTQSLLAAASLQDIGCAKKNQGSPYHRNDAAPDMPAENGCPFYHACPAPCEHCGAQLPLMRQAAEGHWVACWRQPLP